MWWNNKIFKEQKLKSSNTSSSFLNISPLWSMYFFSKSDILFSFGFHPFIIISWEWSEPPRLLRVCFYVTSTQCVILQVLCKSVSTDQRCISKCSSCENKWDTARMNLNTHTFKCVSCEWADASVGHLLHSVSSCVGRQPLIWSLTLRTRVCVCVCVSVGNNTAPLVRVDLWCFRGDNTVVRFNG